MKEEFLIAARDTESTKQADAGFLIVQEWSRWIMSLVSAG